MTNVVVLIVCYNGRKYLQDCLSSLASADRTCCNLTVVMVDNQSTDGSVEFVKENFKEVVVHESTFNSGFAGGNNLAWEIAEKIVPQSDFVYLLNQDTIVEQDFLTHAIQYMEDHPGCGAAQSLLMLHPETEKINTAGNVLHFLFFGLPGHYRETISDAIRPGVVGFCSGASMIVRSELIRQIGLFSSELFLYLEDAELGLKLHLIERPPHLCPASIVYHKYSFSSTVFSYRYLERNRPWLLLTTFKLPTILLVLPVAIAMEFGQWLYAAQNKLLKAKLGSYRDFLKPSFLKSLLRQRLAIQSSRTLSDRKLLHLMSGTIQSPHLTSWLLNRVVNPIFNTYHFVLKNIIFW